MSVHTKKREKVQV